MEAEDHPHGRTTRFKRFHVRDKPTEFPDTGIDLRDQLTRTPNTHVRKAPEQSLRSETVRPKTTKRDAGSDLHATNEPISVNVLRRALPIRSAAILG